MRSGGGAEPASSGIRCPPREGAHLARAPPFETSREARPTRWSGDPRNSPPRPLRPLLPNAKKTLFRRTASLVGSAKVHNLQAKRPVTAFRQVTAILVFVLVRDSCDGVLADRASLVLSFVLVEDTAAFEYICCLAATTCPMMNDGYSSPAPSSRGPLLFGVASGTPNTGFVTFRRCSHC